MGLVHGFTPPPEARRRGQSRAMREMSEPGDYQRTTITYWVRVRNGCRPPKHPKLPTNSTHICIPFKGTSKTLAVR